MKVHEFLDSPDKWAQGCFAYTAENIECPSLDSRAVCWCILGAMARCYGTGEQVAVLKIQTVLQRRNLPTNLVDFNDTDGRTYEEVLAVLKEADV